MRAYEVREFGIYNLSVAEREEPRPSAHEVVVRFHFDPRRILMKNVRVQGLFVGSRLMFEEMNRAASAAS